MLLLPADPVAVELCRAAGLTVLDRDPTPSALAQADALVLGGPDAVGRLADWRVGGHRLPAVVLLQPGDDPPTDRSRLEPVAFVGDLTAAGITAALDRLATGRASATALHLPRGIADLGHLRIDTPDGPVRLSQREADILAYLGARTGREVSREELLTEVWGHRRLTATRSVDMAVSRLRKKIECTPVRPVALLTCRGGGYRLEPGSAPVPSDAPTPLIGREPMLAAIDARLGAGPVVLIGPPGVGKTHLALAFVARRPRRSRTCDLVPVDEDGVPGALARALRASPGGDAAGLDAQIDAALRTVDLLLLDNAEHVVDAIALRVARWARTHPHLGVIVTSRVPLDVPHEQAVLVPPLDATAAAHLFTRCAGEAGAPVPSTAELSGLLPLLDGLPLAIELAAARVRSLGVAALRDRLLAAGSVGGRPRRGVPERHRSLDAAVRGSWALLEPDQRHALTALTAFATPFDLEMARAIIASNADDHVADLTDGSLLLRVGDRYRLLVAIRTFALEHGDPAVRAQAVARHCAAFAAFAREWVPRATTFDAHRAIRTLVDALPELESAWRAAAVEPARLRTQLTLGLLVAYRNGGTLAQRQVLLDAAIAHAEGDDASEAALLFERYHLGSGLGDWSAGWTVLQRVAALAERSGQTEVLVRATLDAVLNATWAGEDAEAAGLRAIRVAQAANQPARVLHAEALLAVARAHADPAATAQAKELGLAAIDALVAAGRLDSAVRFGMVLGAACRNIGDTEGSGTILRRVEPLLRHLPDAGFHVGHLRAQATQALAEGEFGDALAALDAAIRLELGESGDTPEWAVVTRAYLLVELGRLAEAEARLTLPDVAADPMRWVDTHGVLAMIEQERGYIAAARDRLARAVAAVRTSMPQVNPRHLEEQLGLTRHHLGDLDGAAASYATADLDALAPDHRAAYRVFRVALALEHPALDHGALHAQLTADLAGATGAIGQHLRAVAPHLVPGGAWAAWVPPGQPPVKVRQLHRLLGAMRARSGQV
ncbi:MAG: putative ATPase [Myxococcota bacterium]|jgi:predicted ATPase